MKIVEIAFFIAIICIWTTAANALTLDISKDGRFFTLDEKPTFLNGISYYGAQSIATPEFVTQDLDEMKRYGINWIRVWMSWTADGENIGVLTPEGTVREPYMSRLKRLLSECDKRRIIVDCTMSRGKNPSPSNQTEHLACARVLAKELQPFRNAYIDIGNERDIRDARYVSYEDMGELIAAIKQIDPQRLCTASGVPGSLDDLRKYLITGKCDFISPHLGRDEDDSAKTLSRVREMIGWMEKMEKRVPVHMQEPFRRDYASYNPTADDYYRDAGGAKIAGAAGWCLHNGSSRTGPSHKPHRSFCMNNKEGRLFAQLDKVEMAAVKNISDRVGGPDVNVLRFQGEYPEQFISHMLPIGKYRAVWRFKIGDSTGNDESLVTIGIYSSGKSVAERTLKRKDFRATGEWQDIALEFTADKQKSVEFKTQWYGDSGGKLDHVTLTRDVKERK